MATVLTTTDRFGRIKEFYNSDKHVEGEWRIKRRHNPDRVIWQYSHVPDAGDKTGFALAIDRMELADLERRGVKYYRIEMIGGAVYEISLDKFREFARPVSNREKDGSQLCVCHQHWNCDESKAKPKREKKSPALSKIIPLRKASQEAQLSMFG